MLRKLWRYTQREKLSNFVYFKKEYLDTIKTIKNLTTRMIIITWTYKNFKRKIGEIVC